MLERSTFDPGLLACFAAALCWQDRKAQRRARLNRSKHPSAAYRIVGSNSKSAGRFLTRLIWQESSFRSNSISPAGAQGIAQFMPKRLMSVALPIVRPEEAIPKSAELLADLKQRFGNLGLAAAAYNAGPARVANWLVGHGNLPRDRDYVLTITRHPVQDWIGDAARKR